MAVFSAENLRQEYKSKGIFHTNKALASKVKDRLLEYTNLPVTEIVDFCIGGAGLLVPFGENVEWYGCDTEAEFVEYCNKIYRGDFRVASAFDKPFGDKKFNHIVGNFPFSLKCDKTEAKRLAGEFGYPYELSTTLDDAFILANLHYLAENGTCILISSCGVCYRGKKEAQFRKWLLENNYIEAVEHIDGYKNFDDTKIPTTLFVIKKNRVSDTIKFIWGDKSKDIRVSDLLKDEDYRIAVTNELADKEPTISPEQALAEHTQNVRDLVDLELQNVRRALQMHQLTQALHTPNDDPILCNTAQIYIDGLKQIIAEYEGKLLS